MSHNQYGGKTYPTWVGFIFYVFFEKSVDKMPKMEYIIYIVYMQRGAKSNARTKKNDFKSISFNK